MLLLLGLAVSLLQSLLAVLVALALTVVLLLLSRMPWSWYLRRLVALAIALAIFVLPLPFLLTGPGPVWSLGWLRLSGHGCAAALIVTGKAVAVVSLMLILLTTAPLDATLKATRSLGLPRLLVWIGLLTYRYLFLLNDELARLRIALRVRGFRNRPNRHSYRTIGHVAGALLVRGADRAEQVSLAMRCRSFDGRFRSLTDFHTTLLDVLSFLVVVVFLAGLWWLDRFMS
jgi:cobalt/nickel transport system permease protein